MNGRRLAAGLVIVAGIGLAGCSASGAGMRSASEADSAGGSGSGGQGVKAGAPQQPQQAQERQVSQPGVDRKLIRTATLDLTAEDVVPVTNKARALAAELGGFAGKEDVRTDSATLTLHIPSTQFDSALERLSNLVPNGVRARSQTAQDVTEELVDVDSRIATQKTSVARVRDLLAKATSVNEIVQIESEVTKREADLESLEKRRESLGGQVALSTVTLTVSRGVPAPPPAPAEDDGGFLTGLADGWHAFLDTGAVVLRVFGAMLPFLLVLGVPGWFAVRWWWRRRTPATAAATES